MTVWRAGDIGATRGSGFAARLIRFGQRLHGDRYYRWNHIFVVVDDQGGTVEAGGHGVERSNVSKHPETLNLGCPAGVDRARVAGLAVSKLGVEYGYLDVVLLGIDCLTGAELHLRRGDSLICSQLGALALIAGGWHSPLPPALTMPADLVAALTEGTSCQQVRPEAA